MPVTSNDSPFPLEKAFYIGVGVVPLSTPSLQYCIKIFSAKGQQLEKERLYIAMVLPFVFAVNRSAMSKEHRSTFSRVTSDFRCHNLGRKEMRCLKGATFSERLLPKNQAFKMSRAGPPKIEAPRFFSCSNHSAIFCKKKENWLLRASVSHKEIGPQFHPGGIICFRL